MSKINRIIELEIGGELRQCKFTIAAIEQLESMLADQNIFTLVQKQPWSISEIISAAWCGLKVFDRKLSRQQVEEWVSEYAVEKENGIVDLNMRLLAALGMSGLIGGEASAFQGILNALDNDEKEEELGK